MSGSPKLVLASTSRYRQELLQRLRLDFEVASPGIDEQPRPGEPAPELALRLAEAKARAVAALQPAALVIGSDQVADLEGRLLGKPVTRAAAIDQLLACSAKTVVFLTAVCLVEGGKVSTHLDRTRVRFRALARPEVERYVDADQSLDCAGGFRCESLGIALFDAIESEDPTALIGLPLIATARMLRDSGRLIP